MYLPAFVPIVLYLFRCGTCLPNGSPCSAVENVIPGHGTQSTTTPAVFELKFLDEYGYEVRCYQNQKEVTVRITQKEQIYDRKKAVFQGFAVQARKGADMNTIDGKQRTDINECNSNPCKNSGTCSDSFNNYTCTCQGGYTGRHCEDIDECHSNPCHPGGVCTDRAYGYECKCKPGYTGTNCQTDINECASTPCYPYGTCVDGVNGYKCICKAGYIGTDCKTDKNDCFSRPCLNEAECWDREDGYVCHCTSGFSGKNCQNDLIKPEISCPAATEILEYLELPTKKATAKDNSGSFRINYTDRTVKGNPPDVEVVRTWTVTDGSGNSDSCSTTYKYQDTRNPVIDCPTRTLSSEYPVPEIPPNATDSSGLLLTFHFTEWMNPIDQSLRELYRNWTVKDLSQNAASCIMIYRYNVAGLDCADIKQKNSGKESGVYVIEWSGYHAMRVYCDMETLGGGWTVFQRRTNGEVNFNRNWADYKWGFGNVSIEHWLGNEALHHITLRATHELLVELREGIRSCVLNARYETFYVRNERRNYTLYLGRFTGGSAGDTGRGLSYHDRMQFSTFDRDNDKSIYSHCSKNLGSGWWFHGAGQAGLCKRVNLNGKYSSRDRTCVYNGVSWQEAHGFMYSFSATEMKMRPRDFQPSANQDSHNWCEEVSCDIKCEYDPNC